MRNLWRKFCHVGFFLALLVCRQGHVCNFRSQMAPFTYLMSVDETLLELKILGTEHGWYANKVTSTPSCVRCSLSVWKSGARWESLKSAFLLCPVLNPRRSIHPYKKGKIHQTIHVLRLVGVLLWIPCVQDLICHGLSRELPDWLRGHYSLHCFMSLLQCGLDCCADASWRPEDDSSR